MRKWAAGTALVVVTVRPPVVTTTAGAVGDDRVVAEVLDVIAIARTGGTIVTDVAIAITDMIVITVSTAAVIRKRKDGDTFLSHGRTY